MKLLSHDLQLYITALFNPCRQLHLVGKRLGCSISDDAAFLFLTAEAFVGKGFYKKRLWPHAKGKSSLRVRPECRLTVVVREITAEEEAEIARLRVHNFKRLTKRQKRLVPHQLIESNPIWGRKNKSSGQNLSATPA